ncbi:putative cytochrome p450 protein [Botryosphaeria dothidea]|uniref:Cytochrome p450 protein n=1 Tax=Botryosphaeria dothidea TaxID=55169 RepID=A0A8H4NCL7_9PEZI|nr:putative cytochrome p450 protein [Botryosphaeria dothidea]
MAILNSLAPAATWTTYAIATALGALLYASAIITYRLCFHPLSKFPGPVLGKITSWHATWASLQGRSTRKRYQWLQRYGPVARIGPNELVFSCMPSIKDIYGQSSNPCLKDTAFYDGFSITGTSNVFNTSDRLEHARIRRLQSHGFSLAGVLKAEPRIAALVRRFLDALEHGAQPVDLAARARPQARDVDAFINVTALKGMVPCIEWLPTAFVQESVRARPRLVRFARECVDEFRARVRDRSVGEGSLLKRMFDAQDKETGTAFSDEELMENALIFLQAGTGTSLTTVLYFVYEVDRHPEVRRRLVDEIRGAFADVGVFPSFKELDRLPYLSMVFDEVLRLRGPLPTNLPRRSPGKVIGGHYVPAGTLVANLGWATHRDPSVFPDPLAFKPERWANPTPDMKTMFRPFNTGPRNCIGMHLARVQIFLTLGALYLKYDVRMDPKMTEQGMEELDRGVLQPKAEEVMVHVTRRKNF